MNPQESKELEELIDKKIQKIIGFTSRNLTDTPTDALATVNRKYVNMYGTTRPASSVIGQHFFDTSLASGRGKDITWNGTGWVDGTGAYV